MVGVVLATHGQLAEEMLRAAEAVVGRLEQVRAVSITATEPDCRERLRQAIASVDTGAGVLLLADLFGGSPCMLSLSFVEERQVEVVAGVNLPMLLKLTSLRGGDKPLRALAEELLAYGQKSIVSPTQMLRDRS